jgi:hypothetical protein
MRDFVPPIIALTMGLALSVLTVKASVRAVDAFVPQAVHASADWADKIEATDTSFPFASPEQVAELAKATAVPTYEVKEIAPEDRYSSDTPATEIAYRSSYHYYGHLGPHYGRMLAEP